MTFYRKDIFDKAGIPVPRTWPDALEAAKELHSPGTNQYGYVGAMQRSYWAGYQYYGALRSFGGALVDREEPGYWNPTVNSEEGYMALKMLVDLQQYAHPVSSNAGEDEVNTAFANGTAVYGPLTWGTAVLNDPSFTKFDRVIYADLPPAGRQREGGASGQHRRVRRLRPDLFQEPGGGHRLRQVPGLWRCPRSGDRRGGGGGRWAARRGSRSSIDTRTTSCSSVV